MNSFELFKNYVQYIKKSDKFNGMVIKGRAGVGKSYLIQQELPNAKIITGHLTPTRLFDLIKNNCSEESILVFDDCDSLLRNRTNIALLKSLVCETHDGRRIIQYDSRIIRDMEDRFCLFSGKAIFIGNDFSSNRDVEAIINKSFNFDFIPTDQEIMEEILKFKHPNIEVLKFLSENITNKNGFNFRTYLKAVDFFKLFPEKWEELLIPMLFSGSKEEIIQKLLSSNKSVESQIKDYQKTLGKSRRSYFRDKKKVKDVPKVSCAK